MRFSLLGRDSAGAQLRPWLPARAARVALPLLVALGATYGITAFRANADDRRKGQVLLAQIEAGANRQNVEESTVTGLGIVVRDRSEAAIEIPLRGLSPTIAILRRRARDDLIELDRLDFENEAIAKVAEAFEAYQDILDAQLRLLDRGSFDEAFSFDRRSVDISFNELQQQVSQADALFEKRAVQAGRIADIGTLVTILIAIVTLILLRNRAERERKRFEEKLRHQVLHDDLTDLPNRRLLKDRLEHALARTNRRKEPLGVMFIDLDGFKGVNDTLGHECGDLLLKLTAERLTSTTRTTDTVARLGGDEFAVLLEDLGVPFDIPTVVERLLAAISMPIEIADRTVMVSASIGIAIAEGKGETSDKLLANADVAMYAAKAAGKGSYQVFDPDMRYKLEERFDLRNDLKKALRQDEFVLHYQPIFDLQGRRIEGVEALLRWNHPDKGLVPPLDFIPAAEETGEIVPIGRWVLQQACLQIRQWRMEHPDAADISVSVNLSPRQIQSRSVVEDVRAALDESGIEPASLVLEITESTLLHDAPSTIEKLNALKGIGVMLAIDDFGTGYSSLSYLQRFPIDSLKIDRSFISGVTSGIEDSALTEAIIRMARSLSIDTVAEGIEHPEQLERLRELGCGSGQGFLLAKPVPADDIKALLYGKVEAPLPSTTHVHERDVSS
ncbi:MAG: putative bifunctional diguanylate cyclase/phosphodiesterase [Actinomycetota bacterium]